MTVEQIQNQSPDRARGLRAVPQQLFVRPPAIFGLVDAERLDEVEERLVGDAELQQGRAEGDGDGVAGVSGPGGGEFVLPPSEQVEGVLAAAGFVAEVVGPAAPGVDREKVPAQAAGQQRGGDGEVFVVVSGESGAVGDGGGGVVGEGRTGSVAGEVIGERAQGRSPIRGFDCS